MGRLRILHSYLQILTVSPAANQVLIGSVSFCWFVGFYPLRVRVPMHQWSVRCSPSGQEQTREIYDNLLLLEQLLLHGANGQCHGLGSLKRVDS